MIADADQAPLSSAVGGLRPTLWLRLAPREPAARVRLGAEDVVEQRRRVVDAEARRAGAARRPRAGRRRRPSRSRPGGRRWRRRRAVRAPQPVPMERRTGAVARPAVSRRRRGAAGCSGVRRRGGVRGWGTAACGAGAACEGWGTAACGAGRTRRFGRSGSWRLLHGLGRHVVLARRGRLRSGSRCRPRGARERSPQLVVAAAQLVVERGGGVGQLVGESARGVAERLQARGARGGLGVDVQARRRRGSGGPPPRRCGGDPRSRARRRAPRARRPARSPRRGRRGPLPSRPPVGRSKRVSS